ncbi:hypothetical protein RJ640_010424 [Escallonia rubra]|uniref:Uncharacterized protein n=1 Tax=Escallonia rubra TaxID=112253 RepID=A0AA88UBQ3_9ASTE|nr:hypothetical protein RJ640_010424 [Escallonia rubra]
MPLTTQSASSPRAVTRHPKFCSIHAPPALHVFSRALTRSTLQQFGLTHDPHPNTTDPTLPASEPADPTRIRTRRPDRFTSSGSFKPFFILAGSLLYYPVFSADLAHQYQLHDSLHRMKQEPGQSIDSFLSQMQGILDQLELSEPSWTCFEDLAHFIVYRDHLRLIQFLMSLTNAYEYVRSSLLHRSLLPTLDNAIAELLSEETRQGLLQTRHPDIVLVAPSRPSHISSPSSTSRRSSSSSFQQECRYCHEFGHKTLDCHVRPCRLCRKIGAGHFPQDCPRNPEKWSKNPSSTSALPKPGNQSKFKPFSHSAAVADDVLNNSPSSMLSVNDVAEIVKQIMSNSGTPSSSALSVTLGNPSWYFDSGCCNHMISDPFSFISKQHLSHYPLIHTADGSHMHVDHVGHVSTSTVSLPDTYFIPSLKLNLISVGQLCDLGFDLHFSRTGCRVQDPEMGQTIGIGRKVGRLFELINLSIPHCPTIPPQSAASVTSQNSLELWHSRLGHVSFSHLHPLVSSGLLGVGEAALTAVYTINRVPSPTIGNQTPYDRLYGSSPDYSMLKVFGCACFVLLQPHERTKLESRARLCCFIGYGIEHKGYRCWDPISNRLRISRHVVF